MASVVGGLLAVGSLGVGRTR